MSNLTDKKQIDDFILCFGSLLVWIQENQEKISDDLYGKRHPISPREKFFSKLLEKYGLDIRPAKTLENLYQGKANPNANHLTLLSNLIAAIGFDPLEYKSKLPFENYKTIVNGEYKIKFSHSETSKPLRKNKLAIAPSVEMLTNDSNIYDTAKALILAKCQHTIKALINGGLAGKAPPGWFPDILRFIDERKRTPNPVEFELVILCTEKDIDNQFFVDLIAERYEQVKKANLEKFFKPYVCIQNHIWMGTDFLLIDKDHLIFNWILNANRIRHDEVHRTQKGFMIENGSEVFQHFCDFYDKIVKTDDKCLSLEQFITKFRITEMRKG